MTAYTAKAKVTPAALRGEPGALVAARITRPGGTTTVTDAAEPADVTTDGIQTEEDLELAAPASPPGPRRSGV